MTMSFVAPSISDPFDDALMQAYALGDVRAFERLYQRHQAPMHRFVKRLLGDAHSAQADEVFQETWFKIVQAAERYQSAHAASFKTWAFAIAHHTAMDVLRKSGREVSADALPTNADGESLPLPDLFDHSPSAEDTAFWQAAGRQLAKCMQALPDAQRAAFLLHHEEGLSLAQVATLLQVGFESAKSRLRYGMQKLRDCMGSHLAPILGTAP